MKHHEGGDRETWLATHGNNCCIFNGMEDNPFSLGLHELIFSGKWINFEDAAAKLKRLF